MLLHLLSLLLFFCLKSVPFEDEQMQTQTTLGAIFEFLLLGGVLGWLARRFLLKKVKKIRGFLKKRNYIDFDDLEGGGGLAILLGAVALVVAIWLIIIIIRTFWVWFPVLLGIIGAFLALLVVAKILEIREKKMG
jgi:hypothetical protein